MAYCNCAYTPPESRPCLHCRTRRDADQRGARREWRAWGLYAHHDTMPLLSNVTWQPDGHDPNDFDARVKDGGDRWVRMPWLDSGAGGVTLVANKIVNTGTITGYDASGLEQLVRDLAGYLQIAVERWSTFACGPREMLLRESAIEMLNAVIGLKLHDAKNTRRVAEEAIRPRCSQMADDE